MKIKQFYLNIDEDKLTFMTIPLNDNLEAEGEYVRKDFKLSNNPKIIEISHLNYTPNHNSVWDGENFISDDENIRPACGTLCENGCASFAYVIDNTYYGMTSFCLGIGNDAIVYALRSNPTITHEILEA